MEILCASQASRRPWLARSVRAMDVRSACAECRLRNLTGLKEPGGLRQEGSNF